MKRSIMPLLAASIALGAAVTQAKAAFTYDLRLTGGPTAATNGGHTVTNPSPGDYTAQIWARITGDADPTNDSAAVGYVNVVSATPTTPGILTGSGITNLVISTPTPWTGGGVSLNGSAANLSNDGIGDWGDNDQATTTNWTQFLNSSSGTGFQFGTANPGVSQASGVANTWEVLVATLTIHVNGPSAAGGETDFNVGVPAANGTFGFTAGKKKPVSYTLDGAAATAATTNLTGSSTNAGTSLQFITPGVVVPEPASLGVLALGALGLLARRRK